MSQPTAPSQTSEEQERELRNSVFGARAAAEAGVPNAPTMSRAEAARRELGIEIPRALVPLPSRGLVYPPGSALHLKEQVEIKEMTTQEEDILMSKALIKKGTVINELIRSCLIDPNIQVSDILAGDRNALMVAIRVTGYGCEYVPVVDCPKCEIRQESSVNLSDLEIKPLTINPVTPGTNRFAFTLPVCKKDVEFRFLTGKDEEEIQATMEGRKKSGLQNDNVISTRLFHSIISIGGNTDRSFISKFIQYMPARDSLQLRHWIDNHEPGIDMKYPFVCSNGDCGFTEEINMPIGITFFWPKQ